MALVKAVALGAVAAVALPYVAHGQAGEFAQWLQIGMVRLHVVGIALEWSWLIFSVVTLFAWAMLAWSNR
jgi:hypothetical protein